MPEDKAELVSNEGAYIRYVTEAENSSNAVFGELAKFKGPVAQLVRAADS